MIIPFWKKIAALQGLFRYLPTIINFGAFQSTRIEQYERNP